jgi:hypothetical protein
MKAIGPMHASGNMEEMLIFVHMTIKQQWHVRLDMYDRWTCMELMIADRLVRWNSRISVLDVVPEKCCHTWLTQ